MKLKRSWLLVVLLCLGCAVVTRGLTQAQISSGGDSPKDLVFSGTVTKIYPIASSRSRRKWVVRTNVDKVVSGKFSGTTFTFTVHSPTLSGLRVGRSYSIKATWTGDRYTVDEGQWMAANDGRKSTKNH